MWLRLVLGGGVVKALRREYALGAAIEITEVRGRVDVAITERSVGGKDGARVTRSAWMHSALAARQAARAIDGLLASGITSPPNLHNVLDALGFGVAETAR